MIQQSNASRPAVSYSQLGEVYVCVGIYNRGEALHCVYTLVRCQFCMVCSWHLVLYSGDRQQDREGIYYPLISYRCWDINYQARCIFCREKVRDWLYFYCFLKEIGGNVFDQIFFPLCFIAVCLIYEKLLSCLWLFEKILSSEG